MVKRLRKTHTRGRSLVGQAEQSIQSVCCLAELKQTKTERGWDWGGELRQTQALL